MRHSNHRRRTCRGPRLGSRSSKQRTGRSYVCISPRQRCSQLFQFVVRVVHERKGSSKRQYEQNTGNEATARRHLCRLVLASLVHTVFLASPCTATSLSTTRLRALHPQSRYKRNRVVWQSLAQGVRESSRPEPALKTGEFSLAAAARHSALA